MAGFLIVIACVAYLSCDNKYVGAFLFSFALMSICNLDLNLFTGKVCFIRDIILLMEILIFNIFGCILLGEIIQHAFPEISNLSTQLISAKLSKGIFETVIASLLCGIMMFIAVNTYKHQEGINKYIGIFICVPLFILSGFEHSIANVAYYSLSSGVNNVLLFIFVCIIGNSIGGMLIPTLLKLVDKNE